MYLSVEMLFKSSERWNADEIRGVFKNYSYFPKTGTDIALVLNSPSDADWMLKEV